MNINEIFWSFQTYDVVISSFIWVLIFLWIWSIIWVTKDISSRTTSLLYQVLSMLITIIPFFWFMIYFLIRPLWTRDEVFWWKESLALEIIQCYECWEINKISCNYCIYCWKKLKIECKECKNLYPFEWDYCEKCWAPNIDNLERVS